MKIIYIIITFIPLIFIGCSSTYTVSDFPSKEEFYEDFNKSANGKTIKFTLNNDSTFMCSNNVEIEGDTLYCIKKEIESTNKVIALSEIKKLKYSVNNFKAGIILLKDGKTIEAENIIIENNTARFSIIDTINSLNCRMPINNIKQVSYKNHWLGAPLGALPGAILGLFAGISAYFINPPTNTWGGNYVYFFGGAPLGLIVGGILGWISGYTYIYQFNP
jgi:hypothetical protein